MHQIIYMLSILYSWLDITWWMITRWMRIIVIFLCTEHGCIITITLSISLCHLAQSPLSLSVDTDAVLDYELFGHTIPFFCDNTTHANCDPLVWPMKMRGHEMLYLVRKIVFFVRYAGECTFVSILLLRYFVLVEQQSWRKFMIQVFTTHTSNRQKVCRDVQVGVPSYQKIGYFSSPSRQYQDQFGWLSQTHFSKKGVHEWDFKFCFTWNPNYITWCLWSWFIYPWIKTIRTKPSAAARPWPPARAM